METHIFLPICFFFLVWLSLVSPSLSYTVNSRKVWSYDDDSVTADVKEDLEPPRWEIVKPWFEYTNDSFDLQDIVGEKYPEVDEDFDWNQFSGANGIWATFYQKYPPQIGLKPPSISHSSQRPYLNLKIRYYLYGTNASIHVYSSEKLRGELEYRCEEAHCDGFEEDTVVLIDEEGSTGVHNFNVTMVTKNPGEFILIDSITAGGGGVTLATPTTESIKSSTTYGVHPSTLLSTPTEQTTKGTTSLGTTQTEKEEMTTTFSREPHYETTDTEYTTTTVRPSTTTLRPDLVIEQMSDMGPGWDSTLKWFKYVDNSSELYDYVEDYPETPETDWDEFGESYGIWALFHQDSPPEWGMGPPFFSYKSNLLYKMVGFKYYLSGHCSIDVFTSGVLRGHIENDLEPFSGMTTTWIALDDDPGTAGVTNFNISLKTHSDGDLILIDAIYAIQYLLPTTTTTPRPRPTTRSTSSGPVKTTTQGPTSTFTTEGDGGESTSSTVTSTQSTTTTTTTKNTTTAAAVITNTTLITTLETSLTSVPTSSSSELTTEPDAKETEELQSSTPFESTTEDKIIATTSGSNEAALTSFLAFNSCLILLSLHWNIWP